MKKLLLLLLCLPILSLSQQTTDLFISEYGEGSGYNKYIEIYNGTGTSIDLSNYQIWKITNGGSWPEYTLSLSGNLAHGNVYIIYHSSSNIDPIISSAGDVAWSQASWTGDDAVGLAKNGYVIDAIGEDGPDPGNGWDVAGITDATKDHTLVRKCSVSMGALNWTSSAGTSAANSEWVVLPQNDWSDIGQHTFPCQSVSIPGCTDPLACNYDSTSTVDDGSCTYPGCTDSTALNYSAAAGCDDGSCCFVSGCTDSLAFNYNPLACYNDGSCITPIFGCMNSSAMNFDSTATIDDGSCVFLSNKVDLFISEYGEGSSNNKYIEIYNSTSNLVDLSSYALARVSNAPTTVGVYEYWVDFDSAAVILPNDVYIVAHASSDSVILSQADMIYSSLSNGDDGFSLVYGVKPPSPVLPGNEYVILDFIGDFDGDPGSGWDVAGVSEATKDHVLVRKCDINIGNTNWLSSAGTDSLNSEWTVLANEDWSDIGQHTNPCQSPPVYGCTDPCNSCNYNPLANMDDGSCVYSIACMATGCIDSLALNYDPTACYDDSSCCFVSGCTDSLAFNYNSTACYDDGTCIAIVYGCIDPLALNYYPGANINDPSSPCCYVAGCTDPTALNYNSSACYNDGSCISCIYGCTDSTSFNYNSLATCDDGSCILVLYGCTDSLACNYDPLATVDDGSCNYSTTSTSNVTECDDYTWNGTFYTVSGTYIWVGTNANGCDSTATLNLTIPPATTSIYSYTSCGPFSWNNGVTYYSSTTPVPNTNHTVSTVGATGFNPGVLNIHVGDTVTFINTGGLHNVNFANDPILGSTAIVGPGTIGTFIFNVPAGTYNYQCDPHVGLGMTGSVVVSNQNPPTLQQHEINNGMVIYNPNSCNQVSLYLTVIPDGCTDSTACNYDAAAICDDFSCEWTSCAPPTSCGGVTGVNMTDVIHDRAQFNWDDMNDSSCVVDQIRIRYREVGTSTYSNKTMGAPVGNNAPCLNTSKLVLNLTASTQYEYDFKIWYQDGTVVNWHANGTFTTADVCVNATNMIATPNSTTQTAFCWDAPSSPWAFVRLQYRENVPGSSFSNIGGFGVMSPALCKTKNGLTPGLQYRVMWRTWCNVSGGPYRSPVWDGPVIWDQPASIRLEGSTAITNLDVYPNPSRDIFNVAFTSEDAQDLEVRVINVVGEVVYTENLEQFVGEYTKAIDLATYTKGIYFLEITTNNGMVNKKLILQ